MPLRVIALLAAYNEADVIAQVIGHLIDHGVDVYLLDHASTDSTVKEAERFFGRGLIHIEHFPEESGFPSVDREHFAWRDLLRRKEQLARTLDAHWFLHHDADELRESPWDAVPLRDSIARVDALGYNAIDFKALDFVPTSDAFNPGDDLRSFCHYRPTKDFDRLRINAWKRTEADIDLSSSGGHEVVFAGRRVFPVRFLLRHYPIRGQAHGARKVLAERLPRYTAEERARGWHVQYDHVGASTSFIDDPAALVELDLGRVRAELLVENRALEEATCRLDGFAAELQVLRGDLDWFRTQWPARERELVETSLALDQARLLAERRSREVADLDAAREGHLREIATLSATCGEQLRQIAALAATRDEKLREIAALCATRDAQGAAIAVAREQAAALEGRIDELLRSMSWRVTGPLRWALRRLRGY